MTLSCAVEVARRRKIQTIQAIGLSSDQVKKVAMGMKGYPGLKKLDPYLIIVTNATNGVGVKFFK